MLESLYLNLGQHDALSEEEKALVENSVIWSHTRVTSLAEVKGAVIARSCHIGRNTVIREGTVLGDKASIPDYSKV